MSSVVRMNTGDCLCFVWIESDFLSSIPGRITITDNLKENVRNSLK